MPLIDTAQAVDIHPVLHEEDQENTNKRNKSLLSNLKRKDLGNQKEYPEKIIRILIEYRAPLQPEVLEKQTLIIIENLLKIL